MIRRYQIINARIVNESEIFEGSVLVDNDVISSVRHINLGMNELCPGYEYIDAKGHFLIPGVIDDQVHFREPGLTYKADLETESKAAVAGGITSFMDMPNTIPQTLTQELLEAKYEMAARKSLANYSFYLGASNDNLEEILKTDPRNVCGIKLFMGASTGNMLVNDPKVLEALFKKTKLLLAVHCEHEPIIQKNTDTLRAKYGENIPIEKHPYIRSEKACYLSSSFAVELAKKYNTRLHILHLSTKKEMELLDPNTPLKDKRITGEVCIHHLWFSDKDYQKWGTRIKWNPAIKTISDKEALFQALLDNRLDVVATDHAPHTLEEKQNTYFKAPSGGPLIQHSLSAMLEFYLNGDITLEKVVGKMCHAPAVCFQIEKRGFIKEGYYADLVIVNTNDPFRVTSENILYKCKWSPFENQLFRSRVLYTFVNGHLAYNNGNFDNSVKGRRLLFDRL